MGCREIDDKNTVLSNEGSETSALDFFAVSKTKSYTPVDCLSGPSGVYLANVPPVLSVTFVCNTPRIMELLNTKLVFMSYDTKLSQIGFIVQVRSRTYLLKLFVKEQIRFELV